MRTLHQPDLAHHRASDPAPVSVGDTSLLFGALLCAFMFGVTFCSLWMGVPT